MYTIYGYQDQMDNFLEEELCNPYFRAVVRGAFHRECFEEWEQTDNENSGYILVCDLEDDIYTVLVIGLDGDTEEEYEYDNYDEALCLYEELWARNGKEWIPDRHSRNFYRA